MNRSVAIALSFVLGAAFLGSWFCYSWYRFGEEAKLGYETKPTEQFDYLNRIMMDDLQFNGLRAEWIESSWVNGIRDHTFLFKLSMPSSELERLRVCFTPRTEGVSNRSHRFSLGDLKDGAEYLGHSAAPAWWKTEEIDGLPQLVYVGSRRSWRLNAGRSTGYLLVVTN